MQDSNRVILDLRGLVRHAYYSGKPLDTIMGADGQPKATAAHGLDQFIRLYLQPILERAAPIDVIAVQEGQGSLARRRGWFPEYKQRDEQDKDDEIVSQQKDKLDEHVRKLLLALGCMIVRTPFAEADDTIAYLVDRLKGGKVIHTVDNDLLQLARPNVVFLNKGKYTNSYKGMPLQPNNLVRLYKSICGDSSDGFIGVRGIGEKAWAEMLEEFGADGMIELDSIVSEADFELLQKHIALTGNKFLQKLYERRDEWVVSYKLASLHPEWCESTFNEKVVRPKWEKRVPTMDRLKEALIPLGLGNWIEEFRKFVVQQWLLDAPKLARTKRPALIEAMRKSPVLAFDYESYDKLKHEPYQRAKKTGGYIDVLNQVITGCSFAFGNNMQFSFYMPVKHRDTYNCAVTDLKDMFDSLADCEFLAHNNAFEQTLSKTNMNLEFPYMMDTVIMSNYVDENIRSGLKFLSKHDLNYDQTNYADVVPSGKDMRDVSGEEVMAYGCDDSITSAHLFVLYRTIMECEGTWDFYKTNEVYFEKAMLNGFIKGVPLDYDRLEELRVADENLYNETDAELRSLLEEYCSEINEDGYSTLRVELVDFEKKKLREKDKDSEEEIERIVEEKMKKMHAACRYIPNAPQTVEPKRSWISLIAKKLNLPTIRSIKEEWFHTYYHGIKKQVADGAQISAQQQEFLDLCYNAITNGFDAAIELLTIWMQAFANNDKTMWSGDELNARSPKQMAELFYGKMGLPIRLRNQGQKGKKSQREIFELEGMPSTNENALRTWMTEYASDSWQYRILDCVLRLRGINTRFSLYYNPYPLWKSPVDGRTHPQIRNCGTVTKRPSGSSYNFLQVSKTKDEGHTRGVFQSQSWDKPDAEQEVIVSIDFVQQELVILAGESGDENLRACYTGPMEQRRDVHTSTGLTIYNLRNSDKAPIDYATFKQWSKDESHETDPDLTRRPMVVRKVYAKRTNFLATYGGGPIGLARKLIVPKPIAEQFLNGFFESYPGVKKYQDRCGAFARQKGYIETCFGNRRHLYMIHDKNKAISASAERQAGNYPIQGGAADVLKIVMREFVVRNVEGITGCTLYAPIYDELVLSCPVSKVHILVEMLADIMEMELPGLNIKLDTSVSIGKNWGEQIEIGSRPSLKAVNDALAEIFNSVREENVETA